VVVDGGVLGSDAVMAVAVGMKRRQGGRWSMGSKWSDWARALSPDDGRRRGRASCSAEVGGGRNNYGGRS
jgi:hypothetical protein